VFPGAGSPLGEACRGSPAAAAAPGRRGGGGGGGQDVPASLRVHRGAAGLQPAEKRPNAAHDPGVDGSTVSPV